MLGESDGHVVLCDFDHSDTVVTAYSTAVTVECFAASHTPVRSDSHVVLLHS